VASLAALVVLLFVGAGAPEWVRVPLVYGVGCLLLAIGIRQSYAKATAESEIIKQYEFMLRTFGNARRRIDEAEATTSVAACSRSWATQRSRSTPSGSSCTASARSTRATSCA